MAIKNLKDVLGKYGELSPEGERKFANLHGPIQITDFTPQKPNIADVDDKVKQAPYPRAPEGPKLTKIAPAPKFVTTEETEELDEINFSHRRHDTKTAIRDGHHVKPSADREKLHSALSALDKPVNKSPEKKGADDKWRALVKKHALGEEQEQAPGGITEDDHGGHHVKVLRGSNGKFAAFRIYQDGHKEKCSAWYADRSEAQLSAGLKESFAEFAAEVETIEWPDDEEIQEGVEQLDEEATQDYLAHHNKALTHLASCVSALKKHRKFVEKMGVHRWRADDMKHTARSIEDLKDNLSRTADDLEQNHKVRQQQKDLH